MAENTDLGNGNRNGIDKEKFKAALDAAIGIVKSGPKADQYWELGKKVSDAVAETNLTKTIMREISDQSGLGFDTIRKCKKFNGDYGADELKKIMEASFTVSWHIISNNLRIPSDKFSDFCQESKNPGELNVAIKKWRQENPTTQGEAATNDEGATQDQEFRARVNEVKSGLEELRTKLTSKIDELGADAKSILETLGEIIGKLD